MLNLSHETNVPGAAPARQKKRWVKSVLLAALAVALLAAVAVLVVVVVNGPQSAAKRYVAAVAANDLKAASKLTLFDREKWYENDAAARVQINATYGVSSYEEYLRVMTEGTEEGAPDENDVITCTTSDVSYFQGEELTQWLTEQEPEEATQAYCRARWSEIDRAAAVGVIVTVTGTNSSEPDSEEVTVYLVRNGLKWYVVGA